ncbi:MAG: hypothetical protein ACXWID_02430 [Pyrinomonadaceae bacterium]
MQRKKKIRWLGVAGVLIVILLLCFLWFVAWPLIAEDYNSKRGTIAYYVTIRSTTIKDLPLIKVVGSEDFYSSSGDGPKLPANGIVYLSKEDPKIIMDSLTTYLISRGFTKDPVLCGSRQCVFSGHSSSIDLVIEPEGADTHQVSCIERFLVQR